MKGGRQEGTIRRVSARTELELTDPAIIISYVTSCDASS